MDQPASAPERVHRWLCRRLLGLSQGACSAIALAELGRWPLHVHWVQQLARFWNRMLELQGSDRLVSLAFQDNLDLMREQLAHKARTGREVVSPCWCLRWLRSLASIAPTDTGVALGVTELDEGAVVARAQAEYVRAASTPRATPSETAIAERCPGGTTASRLPGQQQSCSGDRIQPRASSKFALYLENIRGGTPLGQLVPYLFDGAVKNSKSRTCLSRFRCSCHDLRIERDRYLPALLKPPRHLRSCLICASDEVEDEHHMIFHCPLYDSLRFQFADLFSTDCRTVSCFLSSTNQDRTANFVYACREARRSATQMGLAGP